MKYFLQSKATGDVIVNADTIKEAMDLAKAYEDNHFDEAIILNEEGDLVKLSDNYTMSKIQENGCTFYAIYSENERKYFAGYDFMGSIDWVENLNDAYWMDDAEAYQIMADLKAADEPAEPETPAKAKFEVYAKRWSNAEKKQIMFLVGEFSVYFHAELFAKAYSDYFKAITKIIEYKAIK